MILSEVCDVRHATGFALRQNRRSFSVFVIRARTEKRGGIAGNYRSAALRLFSIKLAAFFKSAASRRTCAGLFESARRAGRAESESSFYENSYKRQKLLQSLRYAQRQLPRGGSLIHGGAFQQLDCLHRSALLPPRARSCTEGAFSLRLGHGAALGPIQGQIHYRAAASLPSGREPDGRCRFVTVRLYAQKRSPSTACALTKKSAGVLRRIFILFHFSNRQKAVFAPGRKR